VNKPAPTHAVATVAKAVKYAFTVPHRTGGTEMQMTLGHFGFADEDGKPL